MDLSGRRALLVAVLAAAGFSACDDQSERIFPANGSLILQLRDTGLAFQGEQPPGFQVTQWTVTAATVDVEGQPETFDFLRTEPCVFRDNVLLADDFYRFCGDGLVLPPTDTPVNLTLRLTVSAIEVRRSTQPDLPADGDHDGDGSLNRYDNCPMVSNADQADANTDGIGDACSLAFDGVFFADTDLDGVPDISDNCPRYPNPPADPDPENPFVPGADLQGGPDLIGDACEAFVRPAFPDRPADLNLEWTVNTIILDSTRTFLLVDFNNRRSVSCNATLTNCKFVPAGISLIQI